MVDIRSGQLLPTIHTGSLGSEPHGLTYFPNPVYSSLGHNGVNR